MNHWWDRPETPGVDCVDDPEMMAFLKEARRTAYPDSVSLCTLRSGHVRPVPLARGGRGPASVRTGGSGRTDPRSPRARIPAPDLRRGRAHRGSGRTLRRGKDPHRHRLRPALGGRRWAGSHGVHRETLADRQRERPPGLRAGVMGHSPHPRDEAAWGREERNRFRGPLKKAFFEPFVLVYGTRGDPEAVLAMRRLAVLDSQNWYLRADGYAPVLPDTAITPEIASTRNLILYALPGANAVLESFARRMPIRIERDCVAVGRKRYRRRRSCRSIRFRESFLPGPARRGRRGDRSRRARSRRGGQSLLLGVRVSGLRCLRCLGAVEGMGWNEGRRLLRCPWARRVRRRGRLLPMIDRRGSPGARRMSMRAMVLRKPGFRAGAASRAGRDRGSAPGDG